MQEAGFIAQTHTGIRVFYDYMTEDARNNSDEAQLFALERRYCRLPVYRDMGRYVHLLLKKRH
jgi:S-adenosylmethionine-dependent methyltransferase